MEPGGAVLTIRSGPAVGLVAQVALLAALATTVGLSPLGWVVGVACGVVTNAVVRLGLAHGGADALGPADLVTLTRATLGCGVAALVADSLLRQPAVTMLVALTAVALVLDAVDGWVARHTRTASVFGARFDGEVDAFVILVLSVYVAGSVGAWVLAIGAARYVFAVAGWAMPWLREPLPPRYWRKVVAGTQGVVLAVAAAEVMPRSLTYAALAVALVLLAESFGRDVWWLWCLRRAERAGAVQPERRPRRVRAVAAAVTDVLALLLVWVALVVPTQLHLLTPGAFLRIPLEGLVLAGFALVLPNRARRATAAVVGVVLACLTVVKALDMGFFAAFDRPFNLVTDRGYFESAVSLLGDSIGSANATVAVVVAVLLVLALLVGMPLSVVRLTGLVARHRTASARTVTGLAVVWIALAVSGLQVGPGAPVASMDSSNLAVGQVRAISDGVQDQARFDAAAAVDRFDDDVRRDVLAGLRGKDVLLVFVESYGRIAIEGSPSSSRVQGVLDSGTRRLRASGYSSRSAFLTSPTFGGLSWLAHATLQSGLWVDNERRYESLLSRDRMTLNRAFRRAGWRTTAVMPSTNHARWPEGKRFYGFHKIYYKWDFGYHGPKFGFSRMPDQYALSVFQRRELAKDDRPPVMAEVELASSHAPWAPLPHMIGWNRLGDGSVFKHMHRNAASEAEVWRNTDRIEAAYMESIRYSLSTVFSFVEKYGDEDLVVVLVGDHQPATIVTGHGASHDVPVTVIAHDPAVIDQIAGWGWHDGMRPGPQAPVWPMDAFRDRFLAAFSPAVPTPSRVPPR